MKARNDQALASWEESHDPDWLNATDLTVAVRAGHVLAEGTLRALGTIE